MRWKHEKKVAAWNGNDVTLGIDLDGDIGIMDSEGKGYSIIISKDEAVSIIEWLSRRLLEWKPSTKQSSSDSTGGSDCSSCH